MEEGRSRHALIFDPFNIPLWNMDGLTALDLSNNDLSVRAIKTFAEALRSGSLQNLSILKLNHANIGENFRALAKVVGRRAFTPEYKTATGALGNLEELELGNNEIKSNGILALADAAESLRKLKILDLSSNQIGDIGVSALAEAVARGALPDRDTQRISCGIEEGIEKYGGELNQLTHLYLSDNGISDAGVHALANARRKGALSKLTHLDVSQNQISAVGFRELERVFRVRRVKVVVTPQTLPPIPLPI